MHQPSRPLERAHCTISWTLQRALSLPSSLMLCMFQSLLLHSSQLLADEDKHSVIFEDAGCTVIYKSSGCCIATTCKTSGNLYRLLVNPVKSKEHANVAHTSHHFDINLLHRCLGHLGHDNIKWLVDKGMVHGVKSVGGHIELCKACINIEILFPTPTNMHDTSWT